jgi:hypothetical protein
MKNLETSSDSSATGQPLEAIPAVSTVKDLNRRRLLLKGAASTGATVAALQPIGALATIPSGTTVLTCPSSVGGAKETNCTVSGVQSAAHSFATNVTKIPACGKALSYWSANNAMVPVKTWNCGYTTKCGTLLANCNSTYTNRSLIWVLVNASGSDEAGYICAYLNGLNFYGAPLSGKCFPYSHTDVQSFWGDTNKRASALALFKRISTQTA